jgi:hypothetical protein
MDESSQLKVSLPLLESLLPTSSHFSITPHSKSLHLPRKETKKSMQTTHLLTTLLLTLLATPTTSSPSQPNLSAALSSANALAASDYSIATSAIASLLSVATADAEAGVDDVTSFAGSVYSAASCIAESAIAEFSATGVAGTSDGLESSSGSSSTGITLTMETAKATIANEPTSTSAAEGKKREKKNAHGVLAAAIFAAVAFL